VNIRRTTLLIAIILAVGTGWLTLTYLSSLRPPANEQRAVLIATQEIPARGRITAAMFTKEMRPVQAMQPDAISDPSQAVGSLALITIPVGSQLTASAIGTNVASALPVRLQPGMRAVSIPVDRVKDVSGLIQPGDRVDVIAIPPAKGNGPPPKAVTIFRAVRVLAVGNALENPSATPSPSEQEATTVTLEVTPKQADVLSWADANSALRLALRSPREAPRTEPVEELTLAGSGEQVPAAPPIAPPIFGAPPALAPPAPARASFGTPVELIIGDQIVDPGAAAPSGAASITGPSR
jgi:pilus assembly protein CpaB